MAPAASQKGLYYRRDAVGAVNRIQIRRRRLLQRAKADAGPRNAAVAVRQQRNAAAFRHQRQQGLRLVDLISDVRQESLLQTQIVQIQPQAGLMRRQHDEAIVLQRRQRDVFLLRQRMIERQHHGDAFARQPLAG